MKRKLRQQNPHPWQALPPISAAVLVLAALSSPAASPLYPTVVTGDGALGYYRFNDSLTHDLLNLNSGTLGASGTGAPSASNRSSGR